MHQAYNVHSVLKLKHDVQIESIAAYGNHFILGTRSGQLILYSVDEQAAVDMRMFNKISKKPITQMEMIAAENLLFVLTDNMIHVYDISRIEGNFAFIHSSPNTKGCTLFTVDVKTPKSTTGEVATAIRVCCAIKRCLTFFYWDWKSNVIKSLEYNIELNDVPKALCWVDDVVCVGYKYEYIIYNMSCTPPEQHGPYQSSSKYNVEPYICLIRNNQLGLSKDNYLVISHPSEYVKLVDTKKSVTESGIDNKETLKAMLWENPVLGLVWDDPYAVGRTIDGIEVRSLSGKDSLVQRIPELKKTKYVVHADKGVIFAAATSELWCLRMADIAIQRQQLQQQKKYQLAIELTQISDEHVEIKAQTIREMHMLYARELFDNKDFSAAMNEFEKAAIDPYDVIRMFPTLMPDPKNAVPSDDGKKKLHQLEDHDLENAYMALIEFLTSARRSEVVKLRDTKSSSKSLLEIIDTTLLKCYLQTNDSLVAPLLRLNQCHLEESEKTLIKHEKIAELIILYQMNGKHRKALELLKSQAGIEGSVLHGHKRTIRYLQDLGTEHLQLIFEFAHWVLKQQPEEGLSIFTDELIEVEQLPRANVLDFLVREHKALVIPYLEHIIHVWGDTNTLRHNALIKQYREQLQALLEQQQKGLPTPELQALRAKLYKLLEESNNYSPDHVLEDFPTTVLLEERALILGRLNKHEKVLAIYIQVLGDVSKACAYCEAHYESDNEIFHTLIKTILCPSAQPPYQGVGLHPDFLQPNPEIVVQLLNTYASKINPTKIFEYLPDDMPMQQLSSYLEKVMRLKLAEQHQNQIMRGLLEAELERLKAAVALEEQKSFELTESSVCPSCKKRFVNQSAYEFDMRFVRYPNGQVVHLSCHDRNVEAAASTRQPQ